MASAAEIIGEWIIGPLSKANPDFGGLPACPFARKAIIYGQVEIREIKQYELEFNINSVIANFPEGKQVVVLAMKPADINPHTLSTIARIYSGPEFVVLEDHPDEKEIIGNTCVNNGTYALAIIQRRQELVEARTQLESTKYYENFPSEYKQELLSR